MGFLAIQSGTRLAQFSVRSTAHHHPAADTQAASVFLALPLISFTTLLILNQGDEAAVRLIRQLAWVGGTVAAFAILQFQLFPETLLFGEKQAYIDSLTATFVNRNTAATFLGLTALALLVVLVLDGRSLKMAEVLRWLAGSHRRSRPKIGWRLPTTALLLAGTLAALFLTRSRGGVAATVVAFALVGPLVAAYSGKPSAQQKL